MYDYLLIRYLKPHGTGLKMLFSNEAATFLDILGQCMGYFVRLKIPSLSLIFHFCKWLDLNEEPEVFQYTITLLPQNYFHFCDPYLSDESPYVIIKFAMKRPVILVPNGTEAICKH